MQDRATNAKLGQPGFVFHAGWPVPGQKNYSKNVTQVRTSRQATDCTAFAENTAACADFAEDIWGDGGALRRFWLGCCRTGG